MNKRNLVFVMLTFAAVLYGTSYQQFRHFDFSDPRGGDDSASYVRMSYGDYNVSIKHRYRIVIPFAAGQLRQWLEPFVADREELDKLSFYIVNYIVFLCAALLLYLLLMRFGFDWKLSLLGGIFFLSSRITVLYTAIPLVDSLYFLSIAAIIFLSVSKQVNRLAMLSPLFVLSKESIMPFLFLSLFVKEMRNVRMYVSLIVSSVVFFLLRISVDQLAISSESDSLGYLASMHSRQIVFSIGRLLSFRSFHDFQNGFSFFLLFAAGGYVLHQKSGKYNIPEWLIALFPISLILALAGKDLGRNFFSSFALIYTYSLVFLDKLMGTGNFKPPRENQRGNL